MGAVVIVVKQGFDMEKIEAAILRSITKLHHCMSLIRPLQDEANRHRATLRNLIAAYKGRVTQCELDDLLFAIIRDDALSFDDIQIVFDLNDSLFELALQRMRERN